MDDDDPFALTPRSSAAETLDAAAQRLKPVQRVSASLYRAVEVMRDPNGRVTRIGKIWHNDLERVRRFGHALAANTAGEHVQVADSGGRVIETIPPPPPGTPPRGWGDWSAARVPPRELPPAAVPRVTARVSAPKPPPSSVPPIVPPALPASLASAAARAMAPGQPPLAPESRAERTNPLPPTHV